MKRKAFTLIELIAVLVILAILALIVTPLVMNIIKKSKVSADKRSIDAYGRSIDIAVSAYLLEVGHYPTDINQLNINYSGPKVECDVVRIDPSVYLSGCRVSGRSVDYAYGNENVGNYDVYKIGDEVTYNDIDFYVIEDSGSGKDSVVLLKKTPLITAEVNMYGGVRTSNNHVNNNTVYSNGVAYDNNGYGYMAYYSSSDCTSSIYTGCKISYDESNIKYVVDAWANSKINIEDRGLDTNGYSVRLLSEDDLVNNLGYVKNDTESYIEYNKTSSTPDFIYDSSYGYWAMNEEHMGRADVHEKVLHVNNTGDISFDFVYVNNFNSGDGSNFYSSGGVRPVVVLKKSAI